MINCKLCNCDYKSTMSLARHITQTHLVSSQVYYDKFYSMDGNGNCKFCGFGPITFINITKGYVSSCKNCRSLMAKSRRTKLSHNPEKFDNFVQKVKTNQKNIWEERRSTNEEKIIREKIVKTQKETISKMSPEERKIKYGFLNKWDLKKKEQWKETVMFQTGMFRWQNQRAEREGLLLNKFLKDKENYRAYEKLVVYLSNKVYRNNQNEIDPMKLRGTEYHLDHIYSKALGFQNKIDPFIISSKYNLQIIPAKENLLKNFCCGITLEELMERYHE